MGPDAGAEVLRHHLSPEAEAEIGLVLLERHLDPVDLRFDEVVRVVGTHRAAENHGSGVLRERFRQRIAEAGAADVEPVAALKEQAPDPTGGRVLLMQNDENGCLGAPPRHGFDPMRRRS
jgi:hypothetical protein